MAFTTRFDGIGAHRMARGNNLNSGIHQSGQCNRCSGSGRPCRCPSSNQSRSAVPTPRWYEQFVTWYARLGWPAGDIGCKGTWLLLVPAPARPEMLWPARNPMKSAGGDHSNGNGFHTSPEFRGRSIITSYLKSPSLQSHQTPATCSIWASIKPQP